MSIPAASPVIFLLGAGASVEAGVFTAADVTEVLLNYAEHCPTAGGTDIETLLRYVQVRIADFFRVRTADVNFEQILGALMELSRRNDYPIVPLLGEGDSLIGKVEQTTSLDDIISRLYALLRDLVLVRRPVTYLSPLAEFRRYSHPLDIFTLNYDLAVEQALGELRIPFTTGFARSSEGTSRWSPSEFERRDLEVRLFKLHGSVNWARLVAFPPPRRDAEPSAATERATEEYLRSYPDVIEIDPHSREWIKPPLQTAGYVGQMNFGTRKELLYASGHFNVLFNHFLHGLSKARVIVIVGYSFGDLSINALIEEALVRRNGALQSIVVTPSRYPVEDRFPGFRKFEEWRLLNLVEAPFGESLRDGLLVDAVERALGETVEPAIPNSGPLPRLGADRRVPTRGKGAPITEEIVLAWRDFGTRLGLLHFWAKRLLTELRGHRRGAPPEEVSTLGEHLVPLVWRTRDLCYDIDRVYLLLGLSGTYGPEALDAVRFPPRLTGAPLDAASARGWWRTVSWGTSALVASYGSATKQFLDILTLPEDQLVLTAPSRFQAADVVIRGVKENLYELAAILNDIYKVSGYEQPFEMMVKDEAG